MAAFRGLRVSPAKHSYAWLPKKYDYRTDGRTDGLTDRQTPGRVILMCRYASQATQKWKVVRYCLVICRVSSTDQRSMWQFNAITAYLIPSLFRIKADRICSGSNFTVTGNTAPCHVEFIACAYLLRAKRLSHFSFRSPICRDNILVWIEIIFLLNFQVLASICYLWVNSLLCSDSLTWDS